MLINQKSHFIIAFLLRYFKGALRAILPGFVVLTGKLPGKMPVLRPLVAPAFI